MLADCSENLESPSERSRNRSPLPDQIRSFRATDRQIVRRFPCEFIIGKIENSSGFFATFAVDSYLIRETLKRVKIASYAF